MNTIMLQIDNAFRTDAELLHDDKSSLLGKCILGIFLLAQSVQTEKDSGVWKKVAGRLNKVKFS